MKLHDPVRIISLRSTNRLIGITRWVDVRNYESVSLYVWHFIFVRAVDNDRRIKNFQLNLFFQLLFFYIFLFYKNRKLR